MNELHLIFIGLALLVLVIFVATRKEHSFFDRFGKHFVLLTGTFVAIGVIITMRFLEINHTDMSNGQSLKIVDRAFSTLDHFEKFRDKCPNFISTMFFDFQKPSFTSKPIPTSVPDDWSAVMLLGNKIFQLWEDMITVSTQDELGRDVWMCSFLQFAKSKQLKELFDNYKYDYSEPSRRLGALLFEVHEKTDITNPDQWHAAAVKLTQDPRFNAIFTNS
jgi:hypothetical protein